jgi:hypothetical protein
MYAVVICCHTNLMKNLLHIPSLVHKSVKVLVYRECMCTLPGTLDHHYPLLSITIAPPVFLACFLQLPGGLAPCVPWRQLWALMGQHESWFDGHPVNRAEGPAESYPNTQEGSYNMGGSLKSSICLDGFFHEIKHVIQLLGHPPILWNLHAAGYCLRPHLHMQSWWWACWDQEELKNCGVFLRTCYLA